MPRPLRSHAVCLACALVLSPTAAPAQYDEQSIAAFLASDGDGDRQLSYAEFRVFVAHLAQAGRRVPGLVQTFGAYRYAFRRVDADRNGLATPEELQAAERVYEATGR